MHALGGCLYQQHKVAKHDLSRIRNIPARFGEMLINFIGSCLRFTMGHLQLPHPS